VGPWASKLLGEMGADVIKVEAPGGELSHVIPPPIKGTAVLYISANFNKRHIVLDLKQEADRAIALKLIEKSDIFVQNMRPGAVERLGLGYDVVSQINPRLVYVAASAYGRVGPMAKDAGIDPNLQAFSGWCSITGQPGGQGEMFRHLAHLDINTSSMIVEAVLQALLAREKTGKGRRLKLRCGWRPFAEASRIIFRNRRTTAADG
jgi:CoA:oxalate CoA-transferase